MLVTRKAQELDVVELTEDFPEFGLKRGDRGAVVAAFDEPDEAYDLEFVDESGQSKFAYSVKPEQIINIDAARLEAFARGIAMFNGGREGAAERELRAAIEMKPALLRELHEMILSRFEPAQEWQKAITALRFLLRLDPNYEAGRADLATAYMNQGVVIGKQSDINGAILWFDLALGVAPPGEVSSRIRSDLATAYTELGIRANEERNYEKALSFMRIACEIEDSERTRYNLGLAWIISAQHYLELGKFERAVECFEFAIDARFIKADVLNDLGIALASSGYLDRAIAEFERALRMDPDNERIRANLVNARAILENAETKPEFSRMETTEHFHSGPAMRPASYINA